jgi:hypothetical protein
LASEPLGARASKAVALAFFTSKDLDACVSWTCKRWLNERN